MPAIEGYSESEKKYHLILMFDAGLFQCEPVRSSTSDRVIYVLPFDLTWKGHEFLDTVRSEGVWQRIKTTLVSKGGSLAFDVVNEMAKKIALQVVEQS